MIVRAGYRYVAVKKSRSRVLKVRMPSSYEKALSKLEARKKGIDYNFHDQSHVGEIGKLRDKGVPDSLIGNPRILRNLPFEAYTQDFAKSTKKFTQKVGPKAASEVYLNFLETCISYGFYDKTWNLFNNTGVVERDMILLDPGELSYDVEDLVEDLKTEKYLDQHDFNESMNKKERKEFADAVNNLSIHNVRKLWNKASKST